MTTDEKTLVIFVIFIIMAIIVILRVASGVDDGSFE